MKITVRFYGVAYEAAGVREWRSELPVGLVVGDLLGLLVGVFPGLDKLVFDDERVLREYLGVLVNGRDVFVLDGFDTVLNGGDVVFVVPPIGGG